MRKLWYMGLEPYEGRYTLQLQDWSEEVFKRRGIDYEIVEGDTLDNSKAIVTGQVLDAHGRSYFSMSQMMNLIKKMKNGEVTNEDCIFFEDMFQPGFEALPYIIDQIPAEHRPKIFVRCLAQTIDPDDFVNVWGMTDWMRHYELMLDSCVDGILASNEEMVAHLKIANFKAPIYNISGLAFGKREVQSRVPDIIPFHKRPRRVVFAARFDQEKQPRFFMDTIRRAKIENPGVEFALLCGGPLRSNRPEYVEEARELAKTHNFVIHENLKKDEYYEIMANSRVLFNCALQDWVSNTVSEADALGTNVLFPAYRSFPEVFANDSTRMYVPWSIDDAMTKLDTLLQHPSHRIGEISNWTDATIDRCIDIMEGNGEEWLRMGRNYRDHLALAKY